MESGAIGFVAAQWWLWAELCSGAVALGWKKGGGGCGLCSGTVGWCCREVWLGKRGKKKKNIYIYIIIIILIGCIVK